MMVVGTRSRTKGSETKESEGEGGNHKQEKVSGDVELKHKDEEEGTDVGIQIKQERIQDSLMV